MTSVKAGVLLYCRIVNAFEKQLLETKPIQTEIRDAQVIRFMPKGVMQDLFGYAFNETVFIRAGLPGRVTNFVIAHEKFHLRDTSEWLGWFGSETRANISCGLRDPRGLLATIKASLSKKRLKKYYTLVVTKGIK